MDSAILSCDGAVIGSFVLPPFQVLRGSGCCLHLPGLYSEAAEERLARALSGEHRMPGLHHCGRIGWARPAADRRWGMARVLRSVRVVDWLRRSVRLSPGEAEMISARLGLRPSQLISR